MQVPQGESGIVQDTIIKRRGESSDDGSDSLTLESDCHEPVPIRDQSYSVNRASSSCSIMKG